MTTPAVRVPYFVNYQSNQSLHDLPDDEAVYYFAYGFNTAAKQLESRRVPYLLAQIELWPKDWSLEVRPAEALGRAILTGFRLNFNKKSDIDPEVHFASVTPDESAQTEGVLWKMDKKFIEILDLFEGVAKKGYTRELVQVALQTNEQSQKVFPALIYIAHPDATLKNGAQGKTSKRYQQALLNGALEFGFSQATIDLIANLPTVE